MSRIAGLALVAVLMVLVAAFPARAQVPDPPKTPVAEGTGGSAATVDPLATQAAIDTLRSGGNAVDAAVAAAGVLGVVEPFSCGIGGGGFMVVYDARHHKVDTIDSREEAPAGMTETSFLASDGTPLPFAEARVGGLSVGVPGTVSGWETALNRYGTRRLSSLLRPAERIARRGFTIDATFNGQVTANADLFDDFPASADLYLTPGGTAKPVGSVQVNRDLARTYERIGRNPDRFYRGGIARDISETVRHPPAVAPDVAGKPRTIHAGSMTPADLAQYDAIRRDPTRIRYRGLDIYGMAPPSSGGSTIGEALNIMEGFPRTEARDLKLHQYLEASKLAYADRGKFLGDPAFVDVPLRGLLSDRFAAERRSLITDTALPAPQPPGDPLPFNGGGGHGHGYGKVSSDAEGPSTTHLTVADRWGNVVTYTFTIEQIGGSGITVPGRGFLLNNELTDFNFTAGTANSPAPGKRPRSSMAPTMVFNHGRVAMALGSPGGSTIITTVLQILVNRIDFRMSLPDALAAPRASQRNSATTDAEPAFLAQDGPALEARGHKFVVPTDGYIGVATGIRFLRGGRQQSVAEPTRRGGGSAMVVRPG
jgi:gamma-glutamyltranspeptidase/glutathione hydrolase